MVIPSTRDEDEDDKNDGKGEVMASVRQELVRYGKKIAQAGLVAGAQVPYDVVVYSLGPPIERVDILAEAQLNAFPTTLAPLP